MHRTRCYPRWLAGVGLALGLGCGHGSITHEPIVLRDAHATDIGNVESLREVQRYGRWHTRARTKRSTPLVDAATDFWCGMHQRWPIDSEPTWGARVHDLRARDRVDTANAAKAVGRHVFALRCGTLSMIDVERNAAIEIDGNERVRWTSLAASGDTLVAIGIRQGRRVVEDASEIVRAFAVDAEGVPQPRASIELRVGGDASAESGHTSIVGDALVLVRRMRVQARGGTVPLPVVRAFGSPERSRWRALLTEREIQRPIMNGSMLYMTIRCKLADLERSCTANAIMGDAAVAQHLDDASYLWMIERAVSPARGLPKTAIVRLPHDGSRATAVRVPGMPLSGVAWRARPDGSIDAVIGVPHRSGAPGHRVALLRVEAESLLAGLSSRTAVDGHAIALTHANESAPLAFVGNTLLWADQAPGRCVGPSMLRSRGLDDGAVDEIEVPGCIDRINGGASGVLLAEWSTRARSARLWALALAPTLQLGDAVTVQGAHVGALELYRPTRTRYGGEELWVVARLARPMLGPATLVFFSQSGSQLRRRKISSGTPIVGASVEPCRFTLDPMRAYGYGEQLLAALPTGLIELELAP